MKLTLSSVWLTLHYIKKGTDLCWIKLIELTRPLQQSVPFIDH